MLYPVKTNRIISTLPVLVLALFSLILMQCQAPYLNEDLSAEKEIPVVNGILNNRNGLQFLELYYAKPYSQNHTTKISHASVVIFDQNNRQYILTEASPGSYICNQDMDTKTGNSFRIEVVLPNGTVLKSKNMTMPDTLAIDNIFYDFNIKTRLVKTDAGNYNEVSQQGIFIKLRLKQPTRNTVFYRTKGDYYVHSEKWVRTTGHFVVEGPVYNYNFEIRYDTLFDVLEGSSNSDFPIIGQLDPAISYSASDLTLETLFLEADQECLNFSAYTQNTFIEWIFPVDVIATSQEVFNYYQNALEQLEAPQRIYDPIPEQITGNMFNESEPNEPVLGLFDVNAVNRRYYAVYVYESLGYRSYQGRFFSDTVFRSGMYAKAHRIDTIFVDSVIRNETFNP